MPGDRATALRLCDLLPRIGLVWEHAPRITAKNHRDATIVSTIRALVGQHEQPRKRLATPMFVGIFDRLSDRSTSWGSDEAQSEDIVAFLRRCKEKGFQELIRDDESPLALAAALQTDIWIELVYCIVDAHKKWDELIGEETKAQREKQLTPLYFAATNFRQCAAKEAIVAPWAGVGRSNAWRAWIVSEDDDEEMQGMEEPSAEENIENLEEALYFLDFKNIDEEMRDAEEETTEAEHPE
ncbi:hypothetical protein V8F33_008478 [Rhypophila sp. PSN 637]